MLAIVTILEGLWCKNTDEGTMQEGRQRSDIFIVYESVLKLSFAFCGDGKECKDLHILLSTTFLQDTLEDIA